MSHRAENWLREIEERLPPLVEEEYAAKIQQVVPSQWEALGVRVPKLRALATELKKRHPRATSDDLIPLIDLAFAGRIREPVLCALFWLAAAKRGPATPLWTAIDGWIRLIADWEVCDQLAMGVAAPLSAENPHLLTDLVDWTGSPNPWRRRFTAATAAALNQKGRAHVPLALQICAALLQDDAPAVRKAVGWALREASELDQQAVFGFLYERRAEMDRAILREGSQKLPAERRALLLAED